MLTLTPNPLLAPSIQPITPGVKQAERELLARPHIDGDRGVTVRHKPDVRDARQALNAAEALGNLPGPRHARHILVTGRFALWDCVPAIVAKCGRIQMLHVATLGFSKKNVESMARLLDAGDVAHIRLLCSHYFKGTSTEIYRFAAEELGKRKDRAEFLSVRTHAKLLLVKLHNRTLTLESSANLRSCKNLEQLTVIGDPAVHAFHAGWLDELFEKGESFVNCYTGDTAGPRGGEPGAEVGARRPQPAGRPGGRRKALPR